MSSISTLSSTSSPGASLGPSVAVDVTCAPTGAIAGSSTPVGAGGGDPTDDARSGGRRSLTPRDDFSALLASMMAAASMASTLSMSSTASVSPPVPVPVPTVSEPPSSDLAAGAPVAEGAVSSVGTNLTSHGVFDGSTDRPILGNVHPAATSTVPASSVGSDSGSSGRGIALDRGILVPLVASSSLATMVTAPVSSPMDRQPVPNDAPAPVPPVAPEIARPPATTRDQPGPAAPIDTVFTETMKPGQDQGGKPPVAAIDDRSSAALTLTPGVVPVDTGESRPLIRTKAPGPTTAALRQVGVEMIAEPIADQKVAPDPGLLGELASPTFNVGPGQPSNRRSLAAAYTDEALRSSSSASGETSGPTSAGLDGAPARTGIDIVAAAPATSAPTTAGVPLGPPATVPSVASTNTEGGVDLAPARTAAEVSDRVVTMAERVRSTDGLHHFRLEMHPGDLGAVAVELTVDGATVHVEMVAERVATGELLRSAVGELRTSLAAVGLQPGRLDVGADLGRSFGDPRGGGSRPPSPDAGQNSPNSPNSQNPPNSQDSLRDSPGRNTARNALVALNERHAGTRSVTSRVDVSVTSAPAVNRRIDIHL